MNWPSIIAVFVCISIGTTHALERCTGALSTDTDDEFKWKYDAGTIIAYGNVLEVKNNLVKFQVGCTLKGPLPLLNLDLPQPVEVANISQCHYLTAHKNYIIFLQTITSDNQILYGLANIEEIEITSETVTKFLADECDDEDDYGIDMTMFYYDKARRCGQFSAVCNEMNKGSIQSMKYTPLSPTNTFLGGFKKVLDVPKMSPNDDGSITSKQGAGVSDDKSRGAASIAGVSMAIVVFIASAIMMFSR